MDRSSSHQRETARALTLLRLATLFEATTLALLVFIAVPLKHLAGWPHVTSVLGPVHGLAFLLYFWMLMNYGSSLGLLRREWISAGLSAFIPLMGFFTERHLARKQADLATAATG